MIEIIDSFEFQEINVCFCLITNIKPESIKLEKTIPLIQIVSDKLSQWLLCARKWHTTLYIQVISLRRWNNLTANQI